MRLATWLFMSCISLYSSVRAAENVVGEDKNTKLQISIYNNGLALVKEQRAVGLQQGVNDIAFSGVASQIKPETVLLFASGIKVLEQNYDYDLLTANNLVDKSVGKKVKTVTVNPQNGENIFDSAEIVSAAYGQPLLKFSYGIEAHFPGRLVFEKLPENLRSEPTLIAKIDSGETAVKNISLAYLTAGIGWKTDYVAKIVSADKLHLQGWVTINNESGADYKEAAVQLIAGDVNLVANAPVGRPMMLLAKSNRAAGAYEADESAAVSESFGNYHLYNLPRKTDIKDKQTKQISLLEKQDVAYRKEARLLSPLYFNNHAVAEFKQIHPDMIYVLQNTEASRLGLPLPSGMIRFYENDKDGNMQFIGENSLTHLAKGEEARLKLGSSFNLFVSGKIVKISKLSENRAEDDTSCVTVNTDYAYDAEVTFHNADTHTQEVVFEQNLDSEAKVENESLKGSFKDADSYVWKVTIPKEGKQTLTFRVVSPQKTRRCR